MITFEQHLRDCAFPKKVIDDFLNDALPNWARFDSELGYTLGNSLQHDGIGGSMTISTAQNAGYRTQHCYANNKCRINTYGNSFTQCHQVSDGETWQEYLSAHFGEPIRNFGMGGYGVYQAYRRMVRTEKDELGVPYVMLYLWGDDHFRSIMRCRRAAAKTGANVYHRNLLFHSNFWSNVEMDLSSGRLVEKENMLPTPESLYKMCDPEFMVDSLRDDLMIQMYPLLRDEIDPGSLDFTGLNRLADCLNVPRASHGGGLKKSIVCIQNAYGFAATKYVLEKAATFCREHRKQLLVLLLDPGGVTRPLLRGEARYDQPVVDYLNDTGMRYFDMNLVHAKDYGNFNLSIDDYMKRYYIGHYSPIGNHFFAFSLKDALVDWLDPKPITYRADGSEIVDFNGYLPDS